MVGGTSGRRGAGGTVVVHCSDDLIQYTEQLQERKADCENVATEMDVKADKHALDGKVSQSTFDATFEMFDRGKIGGS